MTHGQRSADLRRQGSTDHQLLVHESEHMQCLAPQCAVQALEKLHGHRWIVGPGLPPFRAIECAVQRNLQMSLNLPIEQQPVLSRQQAARVLVLDQIKTCMLVHLLDRS